MLNVDSLVVVPVNERDVTVLGEDGICGFKKSFPSFAVAIGSEPRCGSNELAGILPVDLHSPQIDLFKVVKLGWETLQGQTSRSSRWREEPETPAAAPA